MLLCCTAGEHHSLRISSAKCLNTTDNESDIADTDGNMHPAIQEIVPSPGVESRVFKLPPLAKSKLANNDSRALLDLPKLKRRSSSDSGFRTSSSYSCAGSDSDSPQSHEAISRLNSNRSLNIAKTHAVLVQYDSAYLGEVESISSLDSKPEADKNTHTRRSGTPNSLGIEESQVTENQELSAHDQLEEGIEDEEEGIIHIKPPKGWLKRVAYIFLFPLIVLLFFTLLDVKKPVSLACMPY